MFAYEQFEVGEYVDVFCVGKMTQACAVLCTDQYAPKPGLNSGTFTGCSTDFAAGTQVIEMLRDGDYYDSAPGAGDGLISKHHAEFRRHAETLIAKHPNWFPPVPFGGPNPGGMGGMMRITPFGGQQKKVAAACRACFDEGLVLLWCGHGPYHMRMLPPLGVFKLEDWGRVFEVIERACAKVATG
jgi:4-aminobutyrate aminotransferase-like enzyme